MVAYVESDVSGSSRAGMSKVLTLQEDLDEKRALTQEAEPLPLVFPDGGLRAWLVIVGTTCTYISTLGFIASWGVYQAYYQQTLLKDTSASNIAWIGSLQYALVLLPAVAVGRIFDLGHFRVPFFLGSVALVVGMFLVAECKEYWQFLLVHGILVGLACGVCFGPLTGIVGNWFKKKLGVAWGFTALGGSIGGIAFPIVARRLIPMVGFPWTMRILGFIILSLLTVANLTMRRRLPPKNIAGGILNIKSFRSPAFTVYCLAVLVTFLGYSSLFTFIAISAISAGVSPDFAFYLVSIWNAGSGIGRIVTGLTVGKTGTVNTMVPMIVAVALLTYTWPFAKTQSEFIAIAALSGFTSAAFVSTFQMPLFDLGPIEDAGRRSGMAMAFGAFGSLAGPPISGAIYRANHGYAAVGNYAGSMLLLAAVLVLVTRHLVLKKIWGKF